MLEMKKQKERDFAAMYRHQGDFYDNILRENARKDYIKKLLADGF